MTVWLTERVLIKMGMNQIHDCLAAYPPKNTADLADYIKSLLELVDEINHPTYARGQDKDEEAGR